MVDFPDKRLSAKYEEIVERMQQTQAVIINQLASGWAAQMSYYRFFANDRVGEASLRQAITERCKQASAGRRHVLSISDSTDFDYSSRRDQIKAESGLGYIGDHRGWGYYAHVHMVVDPDSQALLGLSDLAFWHRSESKSLFQTNRYHLPLKEKESYRWIEGCERSKSVLEQVPEVTFVQDREGDFYDNFVHVPASGRHLLVRGKYNRRITTDQGKQTKLRAYLNEQPLAGTYQLEVKQTHKRTPHTALMDVRYARVSIMRQQKLDAAYQKHYPPSCQMSVVYAKQRPETVPPGEEPIEWYLLTTHEVNSLEDAVEVIYWYTLRWLIEEFFRLLKKKGFQLEAAELETGYGLRKLGMTAMDAATRAMQLKQARDGDASIPIEAVFSHEEQRCLERIGPTLEGKTQKLKNPYSQNTLPWASWIIARLGGWKGYRSQNRPGVITFKRGLDRFENMCLGMQLGP